MIFGPDWSFVQNPKTASSAITDALGPYTVPVPPGELPDGFPTKHDFYVPGHMPQRKFRLGVVRNPFDRMVSAWSYMRQRRPDTWGLVSFREFVLDAGWLIGRKPYLVEFQTTPQIMWLAGCNCILRYEHLGPEFERWAEAVLGERVDLPRTNTSERSGGYPAYYIKEGGGWDEAVIETVRSNFKLDLEAFGYGF